MKSLIIPRPCGALAVAFALLPITSQAVLVFHSDLSSNPSPGFTLQEPGSGNLIEISPTSPNGTSAIRVYDNHTSVGGAAVLDMDPLPAFDTSLPGQNEFVITVDFAVTSLGSATLNTNSLPRLLLRSTTTAGGTVANQSLTIGLGRTTGDALILYAARTENAAPNHSSAITLANFGTYSTTTPGDNDTNDAFVSLDIRYLQGSGQFVISAYDGTTLLGSGSVTGFSPSLTFTETTTAFLIAAGNNSTSESYLDNLHIETIPEASSLGLAALAAAGFFRRRR